MSTVQGLTNSLIQHKSWIEQAAKFSTEALFFPELSLTGYEPSEASRVALGPDDIRLDTFQRLSDQHILILGIGLPLRSSATKPYISMAVFQPGLTRRFYNKQYLHPDEIPFFTPGRDHLIIHCGDQKISPAICYESLVPAHVQQAHELGTEVYVASAAKSAAGRGKAGAYYAAVARTYGLTVLLSNSIGPGDNFIAAGQSAAWNSQGQLMGQLSSDQEGLLIYDTVTGQITLTSIP